jgi:chorismate dehydratase
LLLGEIIVIMLKLGHIIYSNCFPPHAGIITGKTTFPFELVEGVPTELNRLLLDGEIDVSPSSSIEYAANGGRYLLLPDISITSRNRVMSIILQSRVPIEELDSKTVALSSASATSLVLLRILLDLRLDVHPNYVMFDQGKESPFGSADAALYIGDLALKLKKTSSHPYLFDLGQLWHDFTDLPFVFALWQVNFREEIAVDLARLYDILKLSKAYGLANIPELARSYANRFDVPEQVLIDYWSSFSYNFGEDERKGLLAFYGYAAELGEIDRISELQLWKPR